MKHDRIWRTRVERRAKPEKPTRLKRTEETLSSVRSIAVSVLVLLVAAFVAYTIIKETFSEDLYVEPAILSQELAKRGLTGQRMSEDLVARIGQINVDLNSFSGSPMGVEQVFLANNAAQSLPVPTIDLPKVLVQSASPIPQVSLPGSGLDAKATMRALRQMLNRPERKITLTLGETSSGGIELRLGVFLPPQVHSFVVMADDLSGAINEAAEKLLYALAPEQYLLRTFIRERRQKLFPESEKALLRLFQELDSPRRQWAAGLYGLMLHERGQYDDAVAVMQQTIRGKPAHPEQHAFNLAQALVASKRFDEAAKVLSDATSAESSPPELLIAGQALLQLQIDIKVDAKDTLMADMLKRLKNANAALALDQGLSTFASSALLHNLKGLFLLRAGHLEQAESSFRRALELSPRYASAANNLGVVLLKRKDLPHAVFTLRMSTELDSDSWVASSNLASALEAVDQRAEALERYERAAELNSRAAICYICLANALVNRRDYVKAIEVVKRGIKLSNDDDDALGLQLVWASALIGQEKYDEAIPKLRRILEARPKAGFAAIALLEALLEDGRIQEARRMYRAYKHSIEEPRFWERHGVVLELLGQFSAADEKFQKAVEYWDAKSDSQSGRIAALTMNSWAESLRRQNRMKDAEKRIRQALERHSGDPQPFATLGVILVGRGQFAEALEKFEYIELRWPDFSNDDMSKARSAAQSKLRLRR